MKSVAWPDARAIAIRGARVIDPTRDLDTPRDLLVEDGKIVGVEKPGSIARQAGRGEVDARGLWVVPGLIDAHVHLREPGAEYKETIASGLRAAAEGGFTAVACMANTTPVNDNPYVTAYIRERAKASSGVRVYPVGALSKGLRGEELAEIGGMVEEGARAISDDGMPVMNSYLMRKAMDYCKAFGIPVLSHAEDSNLVGQGAMNEGALSNELGLRGIPSAAEEILVAREIALCRLTRCPVHIAHISTNEALKHLERAKDEGLPVTAEATPHHLTLTEEKLRDYDTRFKMSPPLRSERDRTALCRALKTGVVDLIASDHAPHGTVDKAVEFDLAANGIIGLQTTVAVTLGLVFAGSLSRLSWVRALSTNPARLLKVDGGSLRRGSVADLTLIDPEARWTLQRDGLRSKSVNSPFLGSELRGRAILTVVAGRAMNP